MAHVRMKLWNKGKVYCAYCGIKLTIKGGKHNTITHDHIIPRSVQKGLGSANHAASCRLCNSKKASKLTSILYNQISGELIGATIHKRNQAAYINRDKILK